MKGLIIKQEKNERKGNEEKYRKQWQRERERTQAWKGREEERKEENEYWRENMEKETKSDR